MVRRRKDDSDRDRLDEVLDDVMDGWEAEAWRTDGGAFLSIADAWLDLQTRIKVDGGAEPISDALLERLQLIFYAGAQAVVWRMQEAADIQVPRDAKSLADAQGYVAALCAMLLATVGDVAREVLIGSGVVGDENDETADDDDDDDEDDPEDPSTGGGSSSGGSSSGDSTH